MLSCEFCKLFNNTYFLVYPQTARSQIAVRECFLNKVASLKPWKLLTLLERDRRTGISLWTLRKYLGKLFCRAPPSNHFSHDAVFFFLFFRSVRFFSLKSIHFWSNGKLGEEIHKAVQSCVLMKIKRKLHCQVVATHIPTKAF